ncbi:MAG: hypothetical protein ACNFW9_03095 [Candidatus Kerfeldbacteria bacterium]
MKTATILMVIAIVMLVVPMNSQAGIISGQSTQVDSINVSGYIAVDANMHGTSDKYKLRWMRLRTDAYVAQVNQLQVTIEYDFASESMSYGYVKKTFSLLGGELNTSAGYVLSTVGDIMTGPNKILFGRWAMAYDNYIIKAFGVNAFFEKSDFTLRVLHSDLSQVAVTYGFISAMWQEKTAYGFVVESPFRIPLLKTVFTVSKPKDSTEQYSVRNYSYLTDALSFNQMYEFGRNEQLTVGFTYKYATNSFVKAYVDLAEGQRSKYFVELTCTF